MPEGGPAAPLAFVRIPRTGGASIRALLKRTYRETLWWRKFDSEFQRFLDTKWASNLQARIVSGVFRRGVSLDDRRATNKIVGLSDEAAAFLGSFF